MGFLFFLSSVYRARENSFLLFMGYIGSSCRATNPKLPRARGRMGAVSLRKTSHEKEKEMNREERRAGRFSHFSDSQKSNTINCLLSLPVFVCFVSYFQSVALCFSLFLPFCLSLSLSFPLSLWFTLTLHFWEKW